MTVIAEAGKVEEVAADDSECMEKRSSGSSNKENRDKERRTSCK